MPTFNVNLATAAARVLARLASLLDTQADATPDRLLSAMRHAVLGGGKRFRPFLVLETADLFGADPDAALDVAAALEFVHCYSLVHDDLPAMDNDALRRGRPTVWTAYDDWTAILAGDALLTLAFEVLATPHAAVPATTATALMHRLALASGPRGMVGGQTLDLEADKLGRPAKPTAAHIARLQAMKTGALITFACESGALLGGAAAADLAAMRAYGETLGRAFQLSDDLLDATGHAATLGKAVGKDAIVGKATVVSLTSIDEARRRLDDLVAQAQASLVRFGVRAAVLSQAAQFMALRDR